MNEISGPSLLKNLIVLLYKVVDCYVVSLNQFYQDEKVISDFQKYFK